MLPQSNTNPSQLANTYKKFAYVFPADTKVSWNFNESTSVMRTAPILKSHLMLKKETTTPYYKVCCLITGIIWQQTHLNLIEKLMTMSGVIKDVGWEFVLRENTFYGVLPTLPYLANYSASFNPSSLGSKS